MFHWLFTFHRYDPRVMWVNDNGTREIACANCTCPKEALGYFCKDRPGECGDWADFPKA